MYKNTKYRMCREIDRLRDEARILTRKRERERLREKDYVEQDDLKFTQLLKDTSTVWRSLEMEELVTESLEDLAKEALGTE